MTLLTGRLAGRAPATPPVDGPAPEPGRRGRLLAALALSAATFAAYTVLSLTGFRRMVSPSWDLGIFEQAVRGYAGGGLPIVDIKGPGFDLLGDHFSPALAALAPVYALVPDPRTLLVLQALLVAVSVLPVTSTAWRLLGPVPGVLVGFAYAVSWGLQSAVAAQFHEVALGIPLMAFALSAFVRGRYRAAALWAAPLVLVKEDLGLTVALLGLLIALRGARRLGAALAAYGLVAALLTVLVVLPAVNGHGYDYWGSVAGSGDSGLSAGWGTKLATVGLLILVTAGLALRSPVTLLVLPTLAWRFAGSVPFYWGHGYHYSAILMPILFLALVDAAAGARRSPHAAWRLAARLAVPASALVAVVLLASFPLRDLVRSSTYQPAPRAAAAAAALRLVPDGATVESDIGLMSRLTSRTTVYYIANPRNPAPQYAVIDEYAGGWSAPILDPVGYLQGLHPGTAYRLLLHRDGFLVLQRAS